MEDIWLARAKRIQALASSGLFFTTDDHDRDRYVELADLAQAMMADLGEVPVQRIRDLVPDFAQAYATPMIDIRAAVIEDGRILLVQEKADRCWCLPGGFADIGVSPADNAVKEVAEETGLTVTARHLFAVRHKARHPYPPDTRDFYKLFFFCDRTDRTPPKPGYEVLDARFFDPADLPELSQDRTIAQDIAAAFQHLQDPGVTQFD